MYGTNPLLKQFISFFRRKKDFKGPQLSLTEMGHKVMENISFNHLTEVIFRDKSFLLQTSQFFPVKAQ